MHASSKNALLAPMIFKTYYTTRLFRKRSCIVYEVLIFVSLLTNRQTDGERSANTDGA